MKKCLSIIVSVFLFAELLSGQGNIIQLGNRSQTDIQRLMIKYEIGEQLHSSILPLRRHDVLNILLDLESKGIVLNNRDKDALRWTYLDNTDYFFKSAANLKSTQKTFQDSSRLFYSLQRDTGIQKIERYPARNKPILKYFYKTAADLWEFDNEDLSIRINPILDLGAGKEINGANIFKNQRGLSLRGAIKGGVYFSTQILETQESFPQYIEDFIDENLAIPGQGLYKTYQSSVLSGLKGFDYLNSSGQVSFKALDNIWISLGHGKNKLGNGERSMMLSPFSNNYLFLKLNTRVWKFHYQNIFAELAALGPQNISGDKLLPKKYMAAHYLSFKPNANFEIGLFESIIFSRKERRFEYQYLNPVILYRTVEHSIGSEDNILLGINASLNIFNTAKIYGQYMIDEFLFQDYLNSDKSWTKKYAAQLGIKYYDAFSLANLDLTAEFNAIRPYTFSHRDSVYTNYGHYNQSLTHPLGANLLEGLFILKYRPAKKIELNLVFQYLGKGLDDEQNNWGGNIFKPTNTRSKSLGIEFLQGEKQHTANAYFNLRYELFHNTYVDINYQYRKSKGRENKENHILTVGFRMNIEQRRFLF